MSKNAFTWLKFLSIKEFLNISGVYYGISQYFWWVLWIG